MNSKVFVVAALFTLTAAVASAADFGVHVGYFDNDVKKGFLGADLMVPLGMIVIEPNVDYWKAHGAGYWLGNADVAIRFARTGPSFWVGAGPTYGYITGYDSSSTGYGGRTVTALQYAPGPTNPGTPSNGSAIIGGPFNGKDNAWGWDVNGGISFSGTLHPYVTARYNKVKNLKAGGVAVGIRFGH
jgi:hypothetical protein